MAAGGTRTGCALAMPRLGVPVNINTVVATFRQPMGILNPLGLVFRQPVRVLVERSTPGGVSWRARWEAAAASLLPRKRLIPLLDQVRGLFEEQVSSWEALDSSGQRQPLICDEIRRQLREYGRRYPHQRRLAS
jgi:hypothetical protein